jgi:hypothetical protein
VPLGQSAWVVQANTPLGISARQATHVTDDKKPKKTAANRCPAGLAPRIMAEF